VCVHQHQQHLVYFGTQKKATLAYDRATIKYRRPTSKLNIQMGYHVTVLLLNQNTESEHRSTS